MECKRYVLFGVVQGVGLRAQIFSKAKELKITGYVKNLSDGTVEIYVCGDLYQHEIFKNWLNSGKIKYAKIKNIGVYEVEPEDLPHTFETF